LTHAAFPLTVGISRCLACGVDAAAPFLAHRRCGLSDRLAGLACALAGLTETMRAVFRNVTSPKRPPCEDAALREECEGVFAERDERSEPRRAARGPHAHGVDSVSGDDRSAVTGEASCDAGFSITLLCLRP